MSDFIEHDLIAFPRENDERKKRYIAILKRRFYEWEQRAIKLDCIKRWRGVSNEIISPHEWTRALFEVFWNEYLRSIPDPTIPLSSKKQCNEIKQPLLESILGTKL